MLIINENTDIIENTEEVTEEVTKEVTKEVTEAENIIEEVTEAEEVTEDDSKAVDSSDIYDLPTDHITKIIDIGLITKYKKKKDTVNSYSSGILPFYVKNKMIYFLLGKDNVGKWSDFGGHSEVNDYGKVEYTAAREFYEESIGSIIDINTTLSKLKNKKNHLRIKDITFAGNPYYMYLLRIPYKDTYRTLFKSTYMFLKYMNNNDKKIEYKYLEKTDIQWVSMDMIRNSIRTDNTEYPLRNIFKKTIESSIDKILEFCITFNDISIFNRDQD